MNGLFGAAFEIQQFCRDQGWRFFFIGGLAVQRWGEPRQTLDVDLTLLTGFGGEADFIGPLLDGFQARIDDAREFALANRVLLLRTAGGIGLDVALGALPFEERAADRASDWAIGSGGTLLTCSAEDLVVFKAFGGRVQDWLDIEHMVTRQAGSLDTGCIRAEATPLLQMKEAFGDLARLEVLLANSAH